MQMIIIAVCEFPIFLFDLSLILMQYIFMDGLVSRQKTIHTYFAKTL